MSIILDALRKSESERLREAEAHRAGLPHARARARMPGWVWAVGALLLANLGVLAWLMNRAAPSAPATSTRPATVVQDLDRVALAGKDTVGARAAQEVAAGSPRRTPDVPPAQYPVRVADPTLAATATAAIEAEDRAAAAPVPTTPPSATSAVGNGNELATTLPAGLPPLEVSLHYYDGPEGKSFVNINGHTARPGTVLPEGPVVEQVTLEGAILNYRGQRFLLPRN